MKEITIYTDGACSGNPGPGGWGAVLIYNSHRKEISGSEKSTTNPFLPCFSSADTTHLPAIKSRLYFFIWSLWE